MDRDLRFTILFLLLPLLCYAATPDDDFFYVANYQDNSVSSYRLEPNAWLTLIGTTPTGNSPWPLAVDPAGRFVFVGNAVSGDISVYRIGPGGALVLAGPAFPAGPRPFSMAADTTGRFLYVALEGSRLVKAFRIGPDGTLWPIGVFATGDTPVAMAASAAGLLHVLNVNSADIWTYRIGPGGELTLTGTPVTAGLEPRSISVHPSGGFVFAAARISAQLFTFRVDQAGQLTLARPPLSLANYPSAIAVHPTGRYLYTAHEFGIGIRAFDVSLDGWVRPAGTYYGGTTPSSLAIDQFGRYLYATDRGTESVLGYRVGATGALTLLSTWQAGRVPMSGAFNSCTVAPQITGLRATPEVLWPPDHRLRPVHIDYAVESPCGPASCTLTITGGPAGDTAMVNPHEVMLRAQREASADERRYTVSVTCTDSRQNRGQGKTAVVVPHDQGR